MCLFQCDVEWFELKAEIWLTFVQEFHYLLDLFDPPYFPPPLSFLFLFCLMYQCHLSMHMIHMLPYSKDIQKDLLYESLLQTTSLKMILPPPPPPHIAESVTELENRFSGCKQNLESKGLQINLAKTKVLVIKILAKTLPLSDKRLCSVCRKDVGRNSIQCNQCRL